jgi:hypothetical protein
MQSSNQNKPTAEDIFKRWCASLHEDKSLQYKYGERRKHLERLIGGFKRNGIEQDDAQLMKRKVVEQLVSKKGMKESGRGGEYSNWKENAENDFDDVIQLAYVPEYQTEDLHYKVSQTFKEDPNIVAWCKQKFGPNVSILTIKEVHTTGSMLRSMFVNEWHNRNTGGKL